MWVASGAIEDVFTRCLLLRTLRSILKMAELFMALMNTRKHDKLDRNALLEGLN